MGSFCRNRSARRGGRLWNICAAGGRGEGRRKLGSFCARGWRGTFWKIVERGLAKRRGVFHGREKVELGLKLCGGEGREVGRNACSGEAEGVEIGAHCGEGGGWNEHPTAGGRDRVVGHLTSLF